MEHSVGHMVPMEEQFVLLVEWIRWIAKMKVVHIVAVAEVDVVDN